MGRSGSLTESQHQLACPESSPVTSPKCKSQSNNESLIDEWRTPETDPEQTHGRYDAPFQSVVETVGDADVVPPAEEELSPSSSKESDSSVVYMKWISAKPESDASLGVRIMPSVSITESEDSVMDDTRGLLQDGSSPSRKRQSFNTKFKVPSVAKKQDLCEVKSSNSASFHVLPSDPGDAKEQTSDKDTLFRSRQKNHKLSSPKHKVKREQTPRRHTQDDKSRNKKKGSLRRRPSLKRFLKRSVSEPSVPTSDKKPSQASSAQRRLTLPPKTPEPQFEEAAHDDEVEDDDYSQKMEARTNYDFDELIPYSKGGCAKSKLIRFGVSENTLRLRKKIDLLLRRLGVEINKELCLNPKGICYFGHDKFVIVVEVPNESDCVFIYSMLHRLTTTDRAVSLMYKALTLNYMQQETRGGCISMDDNEFTLSYSAPIDAMDLKEFRNVLGNFVELVVDLESQLMEANELEFVQEKALDDTAAETSEESAAEGIPENPTSGIEVEVNYQADVGDKHSHLEQEQTTGTADRKLYQI